MEGCSEWRGAPSRGIHLCRGPMSGAMPVCWRRQHSWLKQEMGRGELSVFGCLKHILLNLDVAGCVAHDMVWSPGGGNTRGTDLRPRRADVLVLHSSYLSHSRKHLRVHTKSTVYACPGRGGPSLSRDHLSSVL